MKVLFFGDVFGRPGRDAMLFAISKLVPQHKIDFVIANGENATHGRGITPEMADQFYAAGVDVITMGNHVWDQKALIPTLSRNNRIVIPANYPKIPEYDLPGRGSTIVTSSLKPGLKLGVVQVMGRVFLEMLDCPFQVGKKEIDALRAQGVKHIIVDFHGEASSEKQAFSFYVDGMVSAVLGTHGHVQTADERILPKGTAAITDVGMCGCFDSVIGMKKEQSIQKFLTRRPIQYEPAEGPGGYGAVILELDDATGRALSIQRLREVSVA